MSFPLKWLFNIYSQNELAGRIGIDLKLLTTISKNRLKYYYRAWIPSKNKKWRPLSIPRPQLKNVQKLLLKNLLIFDLPKYVHGGVPGRSIKTNALPHRQKKWVASLDLKDFFPSVHYSKVEKIFCQLGCSIPVAKTITRLVTYDYQLPQGAPTSPIIANLILFGFDRRVSDLCRIKNIMYTRYFDDITLSGNRRLDSTCPKIKKIAKQEGFLMKMEKFRIVPNSQPQIVTGFIVNGSTLGPSPDFIKKLSQNIDILSRGKNPSMNLYELLDKTRGMIAFLNMVQPRRAKELSDKLRKISWYKYGLDY